LRDRQLVEVVQQRRAQLMEAAIGQVHLRLHAHGRHDPPAGNPLGQVAKQGALAHARFAAEDQDATRARVHVGHEPVERFTLVTTSEQLPHRMTP
jgi:hypothetical protein